ncbi:MAG: Flp pilus assembly complex ATPase component TadA [Planctomycetales bacterium]|nr:Flp pilus assembly complex ATPase component TadA [Planctomycetales bacterium]
MIGPQRILVPLDFRNCSRAALEYACSVAERLDARLRLFHVVSDSGDDATIRERIRVAEETLSSMISPTDELHLQSTKEVVSGSAAESIVAQAREYDATLIIMGTHGRAGLAHLALGSVADRVIRAAPCPVLVVRPQDVLPIELTSDSHRALSNKFGDALPGRQTETWKRMHEELQASLDVSANRAERILEHLERCEILQWVPAEDEQLGEGMWHVASVDEPMYASVTTSHTNPAIDLIERATRLHATDIHIDPTPGGDYVVRLRIDGHLQRYCTMAHDVADHLMNRLKTLANLDIAEPFLAQEGRLVLPPEMVNLESRMTVAPVAAGQAVALRLFTTDSVFVPMHDLGLSDHALAELRAAVRRSEGLMLVTGPTGGGKTTTVYSMMQSLAENERNIVSIEDPVEFAVPFVRQLNVNEKHNITMTTGLRTVLRMDPDVIFLGEIRDATAAEIAMRAANSGKYVLSTLHTRSVAATITALRDLSIPDRSIAANLRGVVNQRLVRQLCPNCRIAEDIRSDQSQLFAARQLEPPSKLYRRVGCSVCRHSGYRGRTGLFEVVLINDTLSSAIALGETEQHLHAQLIEGGMVTLEQDAFQKVAAGVTDLEEALDVHWLT